MYTLTAGYITSATCALTTSPSIARHATYTHQHTTLHCYTTYTHHTHYHATPHTQHTLHYTPHIAHYSTHCTTHTTVYFTPHPHPSHLSSVGVCACQTRLCPVVQCCCPSLLPAGHLCSRIPTHTHIIYIHTCMHNSCVYACSSTWTHTHILHGMCEHTL
jgi:hypothetical protein